MKLVVFGLSVSSSWGNGHATLWRGLIRALAVAGHRVVFYERDVPYYAAHRDVTAIAGAVLRLYADWDEVCGEAEAELRDAEAGMVTSYCPDGVAATDVVVSSNVPVRAFYDLDTPVTLARVELGEPVAYLGPRGLADFDLVLSFTGGAALAALRTRLGARRVVPLYGSVDPTLYGPAGATPRDRADLSYLGTYAEDRQGALRELFVEPARRRPDRRFVMAGAQYPDAFPWTDNIFFLQHLPPVDHPPFYASSRATLNVTRTPMARMGYCPSGRLFEAAACGAPIVSDEWEGLDQFFEPGREVLIARTADDVVAALDRPDDVLAQLGRAARARVLAEHTAERRAAQLVAALGGATASTLGV